jgi:DNA-binding SARP family transcriptional activator
LEMAACWLGLLERERGVMDTVLPPRERPRYDIALHQLETVLGEKKFNACLRAGRDMQLDQAVQHGLMQATLPQTEPGENKVLSPAILKIYALGESRVEVNGRILSASDWAYAKARELLFYLVTHPPVTKEQIGLDLWPDASPGQLRAIFHRVLHELRRAMADPGWIVFERGRYRFNRNSSCWIDLVEFEARLAQTKPTRPNAARSTQERAGATQILLEAANLWRGDFLQDLDTGEWAILYRENLRQEFIYTLIDLGQIYFAETHYSAAADVYRRVLALDEYLELAHRELMRCWARMGESGQAIHQYNQLKKLLNDELSAVPSPETTLLYERLRRGDDV